MLKYLQDLPFLPPWTAVRFHGYAQTDTQPPEQARACTWPSDNRTELPFQNISKQGSEERREDALGPDMKSQDEFGSLNYTNERIEESRGLECSCNRELVSGPSGLEAAARAEFEIRTGHPIRDTEWESTKARLVEFARVLRGWHQQRMAAVHPVAERIAISQALPKAA